MEILNETHAVCERLTQECETLYMSFERIASIGVNQQEMITLEALEVECNTVQYPIISYTKDYSSVNQVIALESIFSNIKNLVTKAIEQITKFLKWVMDKVIDIFKFFFSKDEKKTQKKTQKVEKDTEDVSKELNKQEVTNTPLSEAPDAAVQNLEKLVQNNIDGILQKHTVLDEDLYNVTDKLDVIKENVKNSLTRFGLRYVQVRLTPKEIEHVLSWYDTQTARLSDELLAYFTHYQTAQETLSNETVAKLSSKVEIIRKEDKRVDNTPLNILFNIIEEEYDSNELLSSQCKNMLDNFKQMSIIKQEPNDVMADDIIVDLTIMPLFFDDDFSKQFKDTVENQKVINDFIDKIGVMYKTHQADVNNPLEVKLSQSVGSMLGYVRERCTVLMFVLRSLQITYEGARELQEIALKAKEDALKELTFINDAVKKGRK